MHAVHRGVVHARYRDAERDRTGDQPDALLPGQERAQAAIGRDDRDHDRQHAPSRRHARWRNCRPGRGCRHNACWRCPAPSSTAEEITREQRRFADADEEQRYADHQRADQKRDDGRKHQIDGIRRDRRGQHADEMHGPDADRQERRGAGQQHATAHARRPADTRREAEAGVTSQNRDHHRERDEIGIVSCEHDRLGRPSSRACLLPPPSLQARRRK